MISHLDAYIDGCIGMIPYLADTGVMVSIVIGYMQLASFLIITPMNLEKKKQLLIMAKRIL